MEPQGQYSPYHCVDTLHRYYPDSCMYLAMLDFEENWEQLLPCVSRSAAVHSFAGRIYRLEIVSMRIGREVASLMI